jgi:hypothetical protein
MLSDIEPGTDEKSSSLKLEKATRMLDFICAFTVVSNPFTGLECTEHTHYDAVFIASNTASQLNALDFLRILRTVGALTPVVLMGTKDDLSAYQVDYGSLFSSVLLKPFSEKTLCQLVFHIFHDSLAEVPLPNVYGASSDPFAFPFQDTVDEDTSSSDSSIATDGHHSPFPPAPPYQPLLPSLVLQGSSGSLLPRGAFSYGSPVYATCSNRSRTSSHDSSQGMFFKTETSNSGCSSSASTSSNATGVRNLHLDFDPEDVFQYKEK